MPSIPKCQPDGPLILSLIREERGYTVAEFGRLIGRPSERQVWRAIAGHPIRIAHIRLIARGLRVKPGYISDWTKDDADWDAPVTPVTPVATAA